MVISAKFSHPGYLTPPLMEFPLKFTNGGGLKKKLEWCLYQIRWRYVCSFRRSTVLEGQTDRRTGLPNQYRALHALHA